MLGDEHIRPEMKKAIDTVVPRCGYEAQLLTDAIEMFIIEITSKEESFDHENKKLERAKDVAAQLTSWHECIHDTNR